MKLIDSDALMEKLLKCQVTRFEGKLPDGRICHFSDIRDLVRDAPDADQVRHGQWIDVDGADDTAMCSECEDAFDCGDVGFFLFTKYYRYCPVCGAKMDSAAE